MIAAYLMAILLGACMFWIMYEIAGYSPIKGAIYFVLLYVIIGFQTVWIFNSECIQAIWIRENAEYGLFIWFLLYIVSIIGMGIPKLSSFCGGLHMLLRIPIYMAVPFLSVMAALVAIGLLK